MALLQPQEPPEAEKVVVEVEAAAAAVESCWWTQC